MKIIFAAMMLVLSAGVQADDDHEATRPKCEQIRFTGIASASGVARVIEQTLASRDIEDALARNPIQCGGNYTTIYGIHVPCKGIAYFKNHKGQIIDWDKKYFVIESPVDFNTGRQDIRLTIRRKDAVCMS